MSAEGRLIAGRYRLHESIGSGAMGVVWRAVDERLQRTVAVKQLLLQQGHTEAETREARERSMREGRIAARLQHQNAIAVFDVVEEDGQPVLVMEYLPSTSLASRISDGGLLPPVEAAGVGAQVAGALAAAHLAGIVHRDLKPGNILIGPDGTAKITDFGISRAVGDVAVTKSGILAGTPAYLSPEVALGRDPAPASDVFSLGSTLYAAIEGHPPFGVDDNAISLLHRVSRGQVEYPRHGGPMAPVLMELLRADPVERPTMAQARDMLHAVHEGRPVPFGQTPQRSAPPLPPGGQGVAGPLGSGAPAGPPPPAARPAGPQQQRSATMVGSPVGPATRVGEPSSSDRNAKRVNRGLIAWAVAIVLAALVGVLVANAAASNERGRTAPQETRGENNAAASGVGTTSDPSTPTATGGPESRTSTTTSTTTSSGTTSTTPADSVSDQVLVETVRSYFATVTDDSDEAWDMLGPELKSVGRDTYEDFWDSIERVDVVSGPRVVGDNRVEAVLRYEREDGRSSTERHVFDLITRGDNTLINTDSGVG
ncbi:serine/threonine-protein kinase [Actinopolyspora mortivallis]|uniref:non-specific serine/threonine protein kinase n=1 Tax=Actinopolyspora mortivallis TaxID=33906 RepID=A0A2T0GRR5_ACTMO|nr:serine/threonine-protein kinase [Actinopolyspora mortivallis]PRW61787.1 serine/threonine protein kinase [Actinopolyspora mortivallis]